MARQHPLDRRQIQAQRLPDIDRRARARALQIRALRIELAKDLAAIDASAAFVHSGCASIAEYGQRIGLDAAEARALCNAGKAMRRENSCALTPGDTQPGAPSRVEKSLRDGQLSLAAAAALGRLTDVPGAVRQGDDWLVRARVAPLRTLRREVTRRIEETLQRSPGVVELSFHVTERTRDRFQRVRTIESRKAEKPLTDGQTFTRMVDDHLQRHDAMEAAPRKRRMAPTSTRPHSRAVPAEVRRAIHARSGGRCEIPGCDNAIFLDLCHIEPFRDRPGQELEDVFLGCSTHHKQFDTGLIRFAGWDDDRTRSEAGAPRRPRFETADGAPLVDRAPPLPPDDSSCVCERFEPYLAARAGPAGVSRQRWKHRISRAALVQAGW